MENLTPMMQQYMEVKKDYMDCVLFYRLGDFYEMFFKDAQIGSEVLGLTLTGRDCGQPERAPMCGIPYHSCESYIAGLVEAGYKVAICEQMEDPATAKGIVKREVVRVITPGTITISEALDESKNNFLLSIYKYGTKYGLACVDVTTGELYATEFINESAKTDVINEIAKFNPAEMIYNDAFGQDQTAMQFLSERMQTCQTERPSEKFEKTFAYEMLDRHFEKRFRKLDLEENELAVIAVGAILNYLDDTQMTSLDQINDIQFYRAEQYLAIDSVSRYNLELVKTMRTSTKDGALLGVLDRTCTAMGRRMLSYWVQQPLVSCAHIERRLGAVEELYKRHDLRAELRQLLRNIYDMERIISKIGYGTANARDLHALKQSIEQLPALKEAMQSCESGLLAEIFTEFDLLTDIFNLIHAAIVDDKIPFTIREGGIIKRGYDKQLDEWVYGKEHGAARIREMEADEREKTGIKNLKISFNRVFGYYIEVTKSYLDLVPEQYLRKQTLANAERYITPELKELEDLVLRSDEKIVAREYNLFCEVRDRIKGNTERIQKTARVIASIDVLAGLAETALKNGYVKPEIGIDRVIEIKDGRHPVVEKTLKNALFVPNDTLLDDQENTFALITGPNMAGKSTYMRQVAIITIMAQMGSFVPASYARIGIVDKIFTRIGASDDLASGQSTFMVEMNEVANIVKNATDKSLLILDEIGRGTSTFDGLSIAWAVAEYVSDHKKLGARTLFATHYHELTQLEDKLQGVKNYNIVAKKRDDTIVFLRKIVRGGADESYGIEVAKLAGVPDGIIRRAKKILAELEQDGSKQVPVKQTKQEKQQAEDVNQFGLFDDEKNALIDELKQIDLNVLSPIEAMNKLFEMKEKASKL